MMKVKYALILLFIMFAAVSFSASVPLDVSIGEETIKVNNCNPSGGPALYHIRFYISNPYDVAMSVNYSYYDFATAMMVDGGRACTVPLHQSTYCTADVPVRLGNTGDGNTTLQLQLTASFMNNMTETRSKTFNITLLHFATSSEKNIESIISSSEARLTNVSLAVSSVCDDDICCGMGAPKSDVETARFLLTEARRKVETCEFSGALSDAISASALVSHAQGSYEEMLRKCNVVLELYKNARSNISKANSTLYAKAACGANVSESRNELAQAIYYYGESAKKIEADAYEEAQTLLLKALASANASMNKSGECPPSSLQPPLVTQPLPQQPQAPSAPQSDMLSKFIGALGYVVIAAIIIVVGAALYISFGKKWLEGGEAIRAEPGIPPSASGKAEELTVDHSKIDREFEEWLKQTESAEKEKRYKKGK